MPATTGASHGFAAFATLLLGTMLSKFVWELLPPLAELSLFVVGTLRGLGLAVPASRQFAGTIVVMVALSFVWGVVYHLGRH